MPHKSKISKILGIIIVVLVAILVSINILFIATMCSSRQCLTVNIATILLLGWVAAFWFAVVKYLKR